MQVPSSGRRAGVGLLFLVAACGGSSGSTDVDVAFEPADPGLPVGEVLVGDDQAWVVGQRGDRYSEAELWRLDPDSAAPEHLTTVEPLHGASHRATAEGVELAGWRCDGGDMPGCETSVAELVRLDEAGDVTDQVTLLEKPGPLDPSDGVAIAGGTSRSTWVAVQESVIEVSDGGDVLATVEMSGGEHCVIDDRLYALVDPGSAAAVPGAATVTGGRQRTEVVSSFAVQELSGGGWRAVPGTGTEDLSRAEPLSGFCGDGQFEVTTPAGALVATWRPGDRWSRPRAATGRPSAGAVAEAGSPRGQFARLRDGTVVERTSDGAYEPTDLELEAPESFDPGSGPVVVSADSSDTLVAACVTWPVTTETATTSCDVARR